MSGLILVCATLFVNQFTLHTPINSAYLDKSLVYDTINPRAEVAELADALRSGRSEGFLVRVQIPPPAFNPQRCGFDFCDDLGSLLNPYLTLASLTEFEQNRYNPIVKKLEVLINGILY